VRGRRGRGAVLSYGPVGPERRSRRWAASTAIAAVVAATPTLVACVESPRTGTDRAPPAQRLATAPANGFGDAIAWRTLDEGLAEATTQHRPLMLVVHASWCPKCKELKPAFGDRELVELSNRFVMVNVDQDAVPKSLEFAPDGSYVPRVLFVDPVSGQTDVELRNDRRTRTVYYYGPSDDLVGTMRKALSRHGQTQS
jgi:protein-disulfide reductase (glutathione)